MDPAIRYLAYARCLTRAADAGSRKPVQDVLDACLAGKGVEVILACTRSPA